MNKGTTFSVSEIAPENYDLSGFEALKFVDVACITSCNISDTNLNVGFDSLRKPDEALYGRGADIMEPVNLRIEYVDGHIEYEQGQASPDRKVIIRADGSIYQVIR